MISPKRVQAPPPPAISLFGEGGYDCLQELLLWSLHTRTQEGITFHTASAPIRAVRLRFLQQKPSTNEDLRSGTNFRSAAYIGGRDYKHVNGLAELVRPRLAASPCLRHPPHCLTPFSELPAARGCACHATAGQGLRGAL